jgi:sulfoxide reductase heme-binding subunit YedZ
VSTGHESGAGLAPVLGAAGGPGPAESLHPAAWGRRNLGWLKLAAHLGCALPGTLLAAGFAARDAGADPLATLLGSTGRAALTILLVTLAVTPQRALAAWICTRLGSRYGKRLSDWNWLIRLRRPLGLWSFAYAGAHVGVYLAFDVGRELGWLLDDLRGRPPIGVGAAAFVLLALLAATSPNPAKRALGRRWRTLHRVVYLAGILGVVHFAWLAKLGVHDYVAYAAALAVLLGVRALASLLGWWTSERDPGVELPERGPRPPTHTSR